MKTTIKEGEEVIIMMTYKEFKEMAEKRILEFAPEEYQGKLSVTSRRVNKVNMTFDALTIACDSMQKDTRYKPYPTIYIEKMYQDYVETGDFEATMKTTILNVVELLQRKVSVPELTLEAVKDHIVYRLINTAQNSELLANIPNRPFLDLSIVYYWEDIDEYDYRENMLITNDLAQLLGISEDGLYELAKENTRIICPTVIHSMESILHSVLGDADNFPTEVDEDISKIMWVLSKRDHSNGATAMLDNTVLSLLASMLEADLFLLPSSIHEIIAIPARDICGIPEELADMVHEINIKCVKPTERLSNQVYRYDRAADKVILVTDSKNKRLDDDIAV